MAQDQNPFIEHATKSNRGLNASRWGWIVAGILAALLLAALLFRATAAGKVRGLESLRTKLRDGWQFS